MGSTGRRKQLQTSVEEPADGYLVHDTVRAHPTRQETVQRCWTFGIERAEHGDSRQRLAIERPALLGAASVPKNFRHRVRAAANDDETVALLTVPMLGV